jgi:Xaa-Pro aminopeptidase
MNERWDTPQERRTRAVQERLRGRDADALVCFPSSNLRYLTGLAEEPGDRHLLFVVPATGEPGFLVPDLYAEQVHEGTWVPAEDVRTWGDDEDPLPALRATIAALEVGDAERVLVDDTMHARFSLDVAAAFPEASLGLASGVIGGLRERKGDVELDALRAAARLADEVLDQVRGMGSALVGMTEREVAWEIERRLREAGGESIPFGPLVGAGPNGAKPHHDHGAREIRAGEPVVLDFGTRVDGYVSDQTRTIVPDGTPSESFEEVHRVVREAQAAAVDAVEPGVETGTVDRAAREVIEAAGYGEQFVHRTGHGVGLDVHERPYVAAGGETDLVEGMVFSVEPGVYLPGEFGVRIEDLVVVTADGCERLNRTDRGWTV